VDVRARPERAPVGRARARVALVAIASLVAALACRRAPPGPARAPRLETPVPVPTAEPRLPCADVGALRACWSDARAAALVPRPVPAASASSAMGWRCAWPGPARLCVDRRADVPPFSCAGARCTQAHARRPDDGEWTCVDSAGAEVCLEVARAAGVAAAPADPAWICGARRAPRASSPATARREQEKKSERVCVDLSPDVPDGDLGAWRCRADNGAAPTRVCERGSSDGALGVACDRARPCVDGALCAGGRCVPARPAPSCWLDDDCPSGACRFGTCRDEAAP
jgi:hypothetical protein